MNGGLLGGGDTEFLTVREVAQILRISEWTVRRWLKEGKLRGIWLSDRAGWRISREDLQAFIEALRDEGRDQW